MEEVTGCTAVAAHNLEMDFWRKLIVVVKFEFKGQSSSLVHSSPLNTDSHEAEFANFIMHTSMHQAVSVQLMHVKLFFNGCLEPGLEPCLERKDQYMFVYIQDPNIDDDVSVEAGGVVEGSGIVSSTPNKKRIYLAYFSC